MPHAVAGESIALHGEWRSEKLPPRSLEERHRHCSGSAVKKWPGLIICKAAAPKFHTRLRTPIRLLLFTRRVYVIAMRLLFFTGRRKCCAQSQIVVFFNRAAATKKASDAYMCACIFSHMRIIKGNAILLPFSLEICARRKRVLLNCAYYANYTARSVSLPRKSRVCAAGLSR